VWHKMSTNHIEFHHELKQCIEFMRLAVTPAGFAVASVPEESRAAAPSPAKPASSAISGEAELLAGREGSNLRMAQSKSARLFNGFKSHLKKVQNAR